MPAVAQTARPSEADTEARVNVLLSQMTLEEKITLIGGMNDFYTRPIPRLGIPSFRMSDGPLGVHDYGPTTAYPAGISLAASWDPDLARRVGVSMGHDARARGVHFILAPGMNIYRSPLNGRNFEYLGEDPYLAARVAVGLIEGIQSQGVVATAKHFMANNSEYGRLDHSSDLDERTAREIYLPAFEASVKEAKVGAVMDAYNLVNGQFMTENGPLNVALLKNEWGFRGIVMSDWGATHDGVAAAKNGLDLEMPSAGYMNAATLLPALKSGLLPESMIDDKVRRILRVAITFGFFDRPQTDSRLPLFSQEGRQIALEEERAGIVLLKNENHLLPLDRNKVKSIAVLGPNAFPTPVGGGGSSLTVPFHSVSYLQGISDAGKDVRVLSLREETASDAIVNQTDFLNAPGGAVGLKGEYFSNEEFKGEPLLVRSDPKIDFHWGEGSFMDGGPVDHFAVRWSGYFVPQTTDDYRFFTAADDGVRLYINDQLVIDDWKRHSETVDVYLKHLQANENYKIRLEYFENVGTATVRLGISPQSNIPLSPELKDLLAHSDAVVLCMGFSPESETEGADRTFALPAGQNSFIRQVAEANKNVIVVLNAGGSVDMKPWLDRVPALLQAWYPGEEGGTALAQLLFGDYSPSGKLPVTFERSWEDNPTFHNYYPQKGDRHIQYSEGVFVGYRGYEVANAQPLFPFGFGLSYAAFTYQDLKVLPTLKNQAGSVSVTFTIKNISSRDGAEVAEFYVSDSHAPLPRPPKELKGFAKVFLHAGESRTINLTLDHRAFSYYDVAKHDWVATPGQFGILVGPSSADIQLRGTYELRSAGVNR